MLLDHTRRAPSRYEPTSADLDLYREITLQLGAPPTSHMLRYRGPRARHLVELGANLGDWRRVGDIAEARWPDLPKRGRQAADGTELESVPERICYETLRRLVRPPLTLVLHPRLFAGREMRADFGLAHGAAAACRIHLEVNGMLGSDLAAGNRGEADSLVRLRDKQQLLETAGRPSLRVVFLDTLAHPGWLRATCAEAVQAALALAGETVR